MILIPDLRTWYIIRFSKQECYHWVNQCSTGVLNPRLKNLAHYLIFQYKKVHLGGFEPLTT